jgi:hypothetical protein
LAEGDGEDGIVILRAKSLSGLVIVLAACHGSPSEQARKLQQTEKSWEVTAQLTTELQQRGAVPEVYARQTLEAANEELEKSRKKSEQPSR